MAEIQAKPHFSDRIIEALPSILIVLFVLQPLMDILSYWVDYFGVGNMLTLALRFLMLVSFVLLGFAVSKRKRYYILAAAVCLSILVGHYIACSIKGYLDPIGDLTNLVRIMQMPLFAMCFITCLRRNRRCYRAVELGCIVNFWIVTLSLVISLITGTNAPTYEETGFGVLGWFYFANSQSAIVSVLAPIVIVIAYRRRNFPLFFLTSVAALAQLYFLGTRLAYLTIFVTAFGLLITAIICKTVNKKCFLALFLMLAICAGTVKLSPMFRNQTHYTMTLATKQGDADVMMARQAQRSKTKTGEKKSLVERLPQLRVVYRFYCKNLCLRYNVYRVMKAYNYSSQLTTITAVRHQKIIFCKMLLDEHHPISRVFGMELSRMQFHDKIYDAENDFHGVYFLTGAYGLFWMIAFIAYFLFLIIRALVRDFNQVFTLEAGAFGMALCLALLYAYTTAGVLRRPNSSFYLSVILAAVYYLTKLRYYPALPEQIGEVKT